MVSWKATDEGVSALFPPGNLEFFREHFSLALEILEEAIASGNSADMRLQLLLAGRLDEELGLCDRAVLSRSRVAFAAALKTMPAVGNVVRLESYADAWAWLWAIQDHRVILGGYLEGDAGRRGIAWLGEVADRLAVTASLFFDASDNVPRVFQR